MSIHTILSQEINYEELAEIIIERYLVRKEAPLVEIIKEYLKPTVKSFATRIVEETKKDIKNDIDLIDKTHQGDGAFGKAVLDYFELQSGTKLQKMKG